MIVVSSVLVLALVITLIVVFVGRDDGDDEVDKCADYEWLFKMIDQNGDGMVYMNDLPYYRLAKVDGEYQIYSTIISDENWID